MLDDTSLLHLWEVDINSLSEQLARVYPIEKGCMDQEARLSIWHTCHLATRVPISVIDIGSLKSAL